MHLTPVSADVAAGAFSGMVNSLLCSPLDVAKIRQQLQGAFSRSEPKYQGVVSTLRIIYKEEGYRGWFKGIRPSLLTLPLFWALYFPTYEATKKKLTSMGFSGMPVASASAMMGGFVSDVATNPLWVVRTRMVSEIYHKKDPKRLHSSVPLYKHFAYIVKNEGPLALYKGLSASVLGLSHVGIQFPIYEWLKKAACDFRGVESGNEHIIDLILASAISKGIASSITYPHEVIRSRMQDSTESLSLVQTTRAIIASEGSMGLFRGLQVNLVRVLPSCVTVFVSYELCAKALRKYTVRPGPSEIVVDSNDTTT